MSRFSPAPDWTSVPVELKERHQWVNWKYVQKEGKPKPDKVPICPMTGKYAESDNPLTWGTFDEAVEKASANKERKLFVGYVFAKEDLFFGYDLDKSCDEDGYPTPEAKAIIEAFGTYAEISPSGTGVKGIGRGKIPEGMIPGKTGTKVERVADGAGFEIYDSGRFFAITARHLPWTPTECTVVNGAIPWFIQTYINPNRKERALPAATGAIKETRTVCPEKEHPPVEQRIKRAKAYLATDKEPAVSGSNGSGVTFIAAMKIVRGFCLSVEDALVAMEDWNQRCEPPWSERELIHKLENARDDSGMEWHHFLKAPPPSSPTTDESDAPQEWAPSEPQKETVDLKDLWLTPAQAILRAKDKSHRFQTKIPAIDKATSGGIPRGRVLLMAGAPGSGKTTVAIQIACNMAAQGAFVSMLLADEGLDAGVVRMAQRIGFNRSKLESADPETIHAAAKKLGALDGSISCMDPDHEGASLKNFLDGSDQQAAGRPQVWLIDSAQTVFPDGKSDLRIQIKKIADKIKSEGRKRAAVVIFLSQTNRAAYRSKKDEDNSNPLSAAAESGAIEHMADLMVFFTAIDDDHSRGVIPKNRLGSGPSKIPFRLALDRESATYKEVDDTVDETGQMLDNQTKKLKVLRAKGEKILKELKLNPEGLTGRQVTEAVGGKTEYNREALELLRADGKVFSEPIPRGGMLWKASR